MDFDSGLEDLRKDCAELTSYAVESRYPDDVGYKPGKSEGIAMHQAALRVRARLLPLIRRQESP